MQKSSGIRIPKLLLIFLVVFLSACSVGQDRIPVQAVLLPHHLLVEEQVEEVYSQVSSVSDEVEKVVVIGPNHFGIGFNWLQSDRGLDVAYKDLVFEEPMEFAREHSVYVHYPFIEKYFSKAEVLPIIIKEGAPQVLLDDLVLGLLREDDVFLVASIDFTHYESEEVAKKNDDRTIAYLEGWSGGEYEGDLVELREMAKSESEVGIAIDSPETLYVLLKYLEGIKSQNFDLKYRTSTYTETGDSRPENMTSHILAVF